MDLRLLNGKWFAVLMIAETPGGEDEWAYFEGIATWQPRSKETLMRYCIAPRLVMVTLAIGASSAELFSSQNAFSQTINVCTGLTVTLPTLSPLTSVVSGLLPGLDPVLNGIVGGVNTNVVTPLSGKNIGLTLFDTNNNPVTFPGNSCNIAADTETVNANQGITLGGGKVDGHGGTANPVASKR